MHSLKRFTFITSNQTRYLIGSESLWFEAAKALVAQGHEVRVLAPSCLTELKTYPFAAGEKPEIHFYPTVRKTLLAKMDHYFFGERSTRLLSKKRSDLIVISQGGCLDGLSIAEACASLQLPFITVSQAVRAEEWNDDETRRRVLRTFSQAKNNFFVSRGNLELFNLHLGDDLHPTGIVYNPYLGVGEPPPFPSMEQGLRLACVARLEPHHKGQDLILEALANPKWKNRNLKINFYGRGSHEEIVRRLIVHFGVSNQVEMKDFVTSPISTVWAENHALLLPSRSEGFSLALIEAMMSARASITTRLADNEDLIRHGHSGFLIDWPSAEHVDKALEEVWQKRAELRAVGENARKSILAFLPADPVEFFIKKLFVALEVPRVPIAA